MEHRLIKSTTTLNSVSSNSVAWNLTMQRFPNRNNRADLELLPTPDAPLVTSVADLIAAHGRAWIHMPRPAQPMAR